MRPGAPYALIGPLLTNAQERQEKINTFGLATRIPTAKFNAAGFTLAAESESKVKS